MREKRAENNHGDRRIERCQIGDTGRGNLRQIEGRQEKYQPDGKRDRAGVEQSVTDFLRFGCVAAQLRNTITPKQHVVDRDKCGTEEQTIRAIQCIQQRKRHKTAVGEHHAHAFIGKVRMRSVCAKQRMTDDHGQSHGDDGAARRGQQIDAERRVKFALKRINDDAGRDDAREDKR